MLSSSARQAVAARDPCLLVEGGSSPGRRWLSALLLAAARKRMDPGRAASLQGGSLGSPVRHLGAGERPSFCGSANGRAPLSITKLWKLLERVRREQDNQQMAQNTLWLVSFIAQLAAPPFHPPPIPIPPWLCCFLSFPFIFTDSHTCSF